MSDPRRRPALAGQGKQAELSQTSETADAVWAMHAEQPIHCPPLSSPPSTILARQTYMRVLMMSSSSESTWTAPSHLRRMETMHLYSLMHGRSSHAWEVVSCISRAFTVQEPKQDT